MCVLWTEVLCAGQGDPGVRQESGRRGEREDPWLGRHRSLGHLHQEQAQATGYRRRGVYTPPQGQQRTLFKFQKYP